MYDVLLLGITMTIHIFKIPINRFFSKWVFSDMNLITFTVMTSVVSETSDSRNVVLYLDLLIDISNGALV